MIWASGQTRNPYFVIFWTSCCLMAGVDASSTLGIWHFHPVSPVPTPFHTFCAHFHHNLDATFFSEKKRKKFPFYTPRLLCTPKGVHHALCEKSAVFHHR